MKAAEQTRDNLASTIELEVLDPEEYEASFARTLPELPDLSLLEEWEMVEAVNNDYDPYNSGSFDSSKWKSERKDPNPEALRTAKSYDPLDN